MKKKQLNYNRHNSDEEHAVEMFRVNAKYFDIDNEFDILPYSESYYRDNRECFNHKDKLEIKYFITLLNKMNYIETVDKVYNIVKLTEKGKGFVESYTK